MLGVPPVIGVPMSQPPPLPASSPRSATSALEPVRWLPTDGREDPADGTGLSLSGGGYRAMLFHLGALWRLNDAGLLTRLDRISSVSGGSITAATLGAAWAGLAFDAAGVGQAFERRVVQPVRQLASRTVDEGAVAVGFFTSARIGERVADAFKEHLLGDSTLQSLPDHPRFVLNATNLASGALWRFSKPYMADWRVGTIPSPPLALAQAVAASAAFPPFLSPVVLDLTGAEWETVPGNELTGREYRDRVTLTDGGVYDNLGLETVWKRCRDVLVSDAGGQLSDDPHPPTDWARQSIRVLKVVDNQVRNLRERQLRDGYAAEVRGGAYWGIRPGFQDRLPDHPLACPPEQTAELAAVSTRLKGLDGRKQEQLINWGYAACDTALRAGPYPGLSPPSGFPYPGSGVG